MVTATFYHSSEVVLYSVSLLDNTRMVQTAFKGETFSARQNMNCHNTCIITVTRLFYLNTDCVNLYRPMYFYN